MPRTRTRKTVARCRELARAPTSRRTLMRIPPSSRPTSSRPTSRTSAPKTSGSSIPNHARALLLATLVGAGSVRAQSTSRPQLPGSAPSIVEGRVMRPAITGETPVPGIVVTIHRVGPDSSGPIDSMRTDPRGAYRFTYPRSGSPNAIYFAAAVYRGIAYFSAPMRAAVVRGDAAEIVVFDTTTSPVRFTVQGHHLVIGAPRPTGLRDVVEVYEISNDTVVTAVGRDSLAAVWSAPVPRGLTGFTPANGDVSASALRLRDGRVELVAPFSPGVKQLSFTYALDARAFPLEITLDRPNVLLEVPGAQVHSSSLRAQGSARTQGRTFKRFLAQNAPQGERVRIEVPSTAAAARSTVVIGLLVALALAMLVALWVAYRRGAVRARPTRPALESADSLAAAIAALD